MRRILYFQNGSQLGGSTWSLLRLLEHLPKNEYEVTVVINNDGPLKQRLEEAGVRVFVAPVRLFSYNAAAFVMAKVRQQNLFAQKLRELRAVVGTILSLPHQYWLVKRITDQYHPDIIHLNELTLLPIGLAAAAVRVPIVWHVRSILSNNLWGRMTAKLIPRYAKVVVAVSKAAAEKLDNSRRNVQVVYNGIELDRFVTQSSSSPGCRTHFDIPEDAICLGFVGKLFPTKGIFELVEAAPAILAEAPDVHFLIVGGGIKHPSEPKVRTAGTGSQTVNPDEMRGSAVEKVWRRAVELGVGDRFHFTGIRSDIPNLLSVMDLVALPSWSEGLGLTVIEAMAAGKPVVSTHVDAIPEIITHEQTGLLVPAKDSQQLAEACIRLIKNPSWAKQIGANARDSVIHRFDSRDYCLRIQAVYDTLYSEKRDSIQREGSST